MRDTATPNTTIRGHGPGTHRAAPSGEVPPQGAAGRIAAALGALRTWWTSGRHYHPEWRYMRGGRLTTRP